MTAIQHALKELQQQQQQAREESERHSSKGGKGEGKKGGKGGKGGSHKENSNKAASQPTAANGRAAQVPVWGDADHVRHATSAGLLSTLAGATDELLEVVEAEIDRHASKNLHVTPIAKLPAVSEMIHSSMQ